jgi:hypothetical protein
MPAGLKSNAAASYNQSHHRMMQVTPVSIASTAREPYKCCSRTGTFPFHQQFIGKISITEAVHICYPIADKFISI